MTLKLGLVHTPVTPFTRERRIDFERYGRLLEFHLANGAEALALPMHAGESVSLTDAERLESIQFAVTQVKKRVPVVAHVSQSGTALAVDLARGAQKAGADAIIATNPYYWTPKDPMLTEHFTQIGRAVRIPFFVYNAPEDNAGREISLNVALELIQRLDNFAGFVDRSLDWVFMTELVSNCKRARADFQVIGIEYMVPVFVVGATGAFVCRRAKTLALEARNCKCNNTAERYGRFAFAYAQCVLRLQGMQKVCLGRKSWLQACLPGCLDRWTVLIAIG